MEDREDRWSLSSEDHDVLVRIAEAVHNLAPLAGCGNDLIALGEAWDAIEHVLGGNSVEVSVGLSIGFRRGHGEFEEGLFLGLRINNDEIVLDELNTTYSKDVGSDHFTRDYAFIGRGGGFDEAGVEDWLSKLSEILRFDDVSLRADRDHL